MELVPGKPLDYVIEHRWAIPVEAKLTLMARVCSALDYAHRRQIIHRDLKPSNILVEADDSPKIIDFGIAKLIGNDVTRTNTRMGTAAYM